MSLGVTDLNLSIGRAEVLKGISAKAERGEVTAICGPNGAGKSTLLAAMAGLHPVAGAVSVEGAPLETLHPRERARRIGYLPQQGEVAWDVAVSSLVQLGRLPHGDQGAEAVERAMAMLDLGAVAHRPVSQLSGGERARALLGRVLAGEPQWILADEPFAALDLAHQLSLLGHFRAIAGQDKGVVVVLHDLSLAMNHADRVFVLGEGRLVAEGTPEQALAEAVLLQVWGVDARWIGEPGSRALVTEIAR
jgi:iron complex transport system ATP-binding protein